MQIGGGGIQKNEERKKRRKTSPQTRQTLDKVSNEKERAKKKGASGRSAVGGEVENKGIMKA